MGDDAPGQTVAGGSGFGRWIASKAGGKLDRLEAGHGSRGVQWAGFASVAIQVVGEISAPWGENVHIGSSRVSSDRISARTKLCAGQHHHGPDMDLTIILCEANKLAERPLDLVHLLAQGAPHAQIVGSDLARMAHCASTGNGRAITRRES